jgi:hypothetical protein
MVGSHSSKVDKSDTYILDASTSICKAALHRVTQAAVPSNGNQNLPQRSFPANRLELIGLGTIYSMSNRCASLFPSHEAMLKYLLEMYDQAEAGDVIWAQCIRCTDFTPSVRTKILEAASRGVRFQIVVNQHSPAGEEFQALFDPIEGAEVTRSPNNAISMQGLSEREVVIAFPGVESYTAVLIRDKYFVGIAKSWFDRLCVYKRC